MRSHTSIELAGPSSLSVSRLPLNSYLCTKSVPIHDGFDAASTWWLTTRRDSSTPKVP